MKIRNVIAILSITGSAFFTAGCRKSGETRLGVDIPGGAPVVKLADVFENPQQYNGKEVVIKGVVSGQCPSYCEFFMKEGPHQATIFPKGYQLPRMETGRPVTVYASVTAGTRNTVLTALGVRME